MKNEHKSNDLKKVKADNLKKSTKVHFCMIKKSLTDVQAIVFSGGSVIVSANDYPSYSLQSLALTAKSHGAKIIIKNASLLTTTQCKSIAFSGGGQGVVTFDFTD